MGIRPSKMLHPATPLIVSAPPSHQVLSHYISTLLPFPPLPTDVPFTYHLPRAHPLNPTLTSTSHLVLSLTPSAAFHAALQSLPSPLPTPSPLSTDAPALPLAFLHRPWGLDRACGARVLASHTGFDAGLTVGWNVALARRLGLDVDGAGAVVGLKGYKGDSERRIGVVAGFQVVGGGRTGAEKGPFLGRVLEEFGVGAGGSESGGLGNGGEEGRMVFDYTFGDQSVAPQSQDGVSEHRIAAVAIMNAFSPTEVQRVTDAADAAGLLSQGGRIVYLTGQARAPGLEAAEKAGMLVVCVGHRAAEEWGLRYMARCVREEFPGLEVAEVYAEDVEVVKNRERVRNRGTPAEVKEDE